MKWTPGGRSPNVEDRRGEGGGRGGLKIGLVGFLLLAIGSIVFRTNLFALFEGTEPPSEQAGNPETTASPEEEREIEFVSFVLDDVQGTWKGLFAAAGTPWHDATLVLYRDGTDTGCGYADAGAGPFYCPADEKVYLDLSFFEELRRRFGAPGDFAQAYVIAHEIGHHVQHLLGTDTRARAAGATNATSVALELQADCYAGVWGHSTEERDILESGDADEALGAAAAVGDDRLARQAGRPVNAETFTHGTSQQRRDWFARGFTTGRMDRCDTFAGVGTR